MMSKKLLFLLRLLSPFISVKSYYECFLKLLSFVVLNQKSTHRISRQVSCQGPLLRGHL